MIPGQTYKIDPRDLNKNIAIGISLPFNGPAVFNSTYSTKDQLKYNLINLILTNKGERIENPEFGSNVKRFIFEFITEDNLDNLKELISTSIFTYLPEITIQDINPNLDPDLNMITLSINYFINISGEADQITIAFE